MLHTKYKLLTLSAGLCSALLFNSAHAANWLMLQGTEPADAAPRAKVWGFIQAQYQKDNSDPNAAGQYVPPKLVGPQLTSQKQFNVNRARIGVRGTGFPLDANINYFFLAEFGTNGITNGQNASGHVTDASITLNEIPGARIRAGLFKYPGAEEGLQAIHVFDYINFTTVSNQLLLERFPNKSFTYENSPTTLPTQNGMGAFDKPVGAFRDVGVQVFDTFKVNNWEHSYAVMVGNGEGLNGGDTDNNFDTYLYWSSELVFGGKGPRREGLKLFAWSQDGKRLLDNTPCAVPTSCTSADYDPKEYDRKRSGFGIKYLRKPYRVTVEYMKGEGMIFVGPDKPTFDVNTVSKPGGVSTNSKASGYYVDGGWYIPNSKWEIDLRYDVYNRMEDDKFEFQFKTMTYGFQYHFNKKTHLTVDYADRKFEAVNFASGAGPNDNLDGVDSRLAAQITHIF